MTPKDKRLPVIAAAGIILLVLSLLMDSVLLPWVDNFSIDRQVQRTTQALHEKEARVNELLEKWSAMSPDELFKNQEEVYEAAASEGILFYIYNKRNLLFWTDNKVFPQQLLPNEELSLQKLANGYYLQKNLPANDFDHIALIPVLNRYGFENQYLKNKLVLSPILTEVKLYERPAANAQDIHSEDGFYLFSLKISGSGFSEGWTRAVFTLGLILLVFALHRFIRQLLTRKKDSLAIAVFAGFAALFTLLWKVLGIPHAFFKHDLFDPQHYASSYLFASVGDLLIFTLLLCYGLWLSMRIKQPASSSQRQNLLFKGLELLFIFTFAALLEHVISSLVIDSKISFNLSNFFSLSGYSILGLVILYIWLYCLFLWSRSFASAISRTLPLWKHFLLFLSVIAAIAAGGLYFLGMLYGKAIVFACGYILFLYILKRTDRKNALSLYVGSLALSAAFITLLLSHYNTQKTWYTQRAVAQQIITERDAVAEYLFNGLYDKLRADPYIKNYFTNPVLAESFIENRLKQLYFSGYFSKYDISLSSFSAEGLPLKATTSRPLSYYLNYLSKNATPVLGSYLYFLHQFNGLPSYVAAIPVSRGKVFLGTVLVEFQQKPFYEESVYPELLLTDNFQRYNVLQNFSYAVYNNNILSTQKGDFPYPGVTPGAFRASGEVYNRVRAKDHDHLVYHFSENLMVVVSSQQKTLIQVLSTFSFLLLFFGLLWVIQLALPHLWEFWYRLVAPDGKPIDIKPLWQGLAFRYKILATVIGSMTIAMLLIGLATVKYIMYQYSQEEQERLRRKTVVVTSRVENALEETDPTQTVSEDELNSILKDISSVYEADINLFDIQGNLLATTQGLLYEQNIIAPKMDALAYIRFNGQYASQLVHEERIGDLSFIASYMPLRNVLGQVSGYLNIPYFSKEQELNERISSFMVALINIYLLLFIVLLMLGIFMSKGLTGPLDIIRRHLRSTKLGKSKPIEELQTDDEIGKMIKEYNTMILELEESANRLAQTQREMVGRDMARQVAHEIKNPLTPMKLNLQRLQRAYVEGADDFDTIFRRVTMLLINQIESLSEIATSFSTYARLPEGEPEAVDVNKALRQAAELFSQSQEVRISLEPSPENPLCYIDSDQLGRVFNNLIKNAMQAFPDTRQGLILLKSMIEDGKVKIIVQDNAAGIPEELKDKIFTPNFSTKSGGMGLGLAIAKDMIEKAGGSISFTTVAGEGTTFVITLPVYRGQEVQP